MSGAYQDAGDESDDEDGGAEVDGPFFGIPAQVLFCVKEA